MVAYRRALNSWPGRAIVAEEPSQGQIGPKSGRDLHMVIQSKSVMMGKPGALDTRR